MTAQTKSEKDRVVIFDTTLRDGEQCPGATMTHEEKLEVAELLDEMGVDIIEAGFAIASQGDFESVQEIARRAKNSVICGLARAQAKDIDVCADAIKPAKQGRIRNRSICPRSSRKWATVSRFSPRSATKSSRRGRTGQGRPEVIGSPCGHGA